MKIALPDPFNRIVRLLGRRSHPRDWPKSFDSWDAYDADGEFLLTLHYKALNQLLDAKHYTHDVVLQFEDDPDNERTITVTPALTFKIRIRLNFGDDFHVDNPDVILSKAEMRQVLLDAMTTVPNTTQRLKDT